MQANGSLETGEAGREASKAAAPPEGTLPGSVRGERASWAECGLDPVVSTAESDFIEALFDFSRLARTCDAPDAGGYTRLQVALLARLDRDGGTRLTALAEILDADLSVISRQVTVLTEAGLVQRHQDPSDRRAYLITITPKGSEAVWTVRRRRAAWWHRTLAAWTPEELHLAAAVVRATVAAGTTRGNHEEK